tara:strand:- start:843 stop:1349 length:507 start_codon:yes stop_codon:yes gene_type:complete
MNNKPLACKPKNAYTVYFNVIWYFLFFNWLLNNKKNTYNQISKEILCGVSINLIPFFIISHYIFYYTKLPELCYGSKNIPISYYIKKDILLHKVIILVFLYNFINLKNGFNFESRYFWLGIIGSLIITIIYGLIYNFDTNLYSVSFKYLIYQYVIFFILSLVLFKNIS